MRIAIRHRTHYLYGAAVKHAVQQLRLTPPELPTQHIVEWRITAPGIEDAVCYLDAFGNTVHLITGFGAIEQVEITASGVVETGDSAGILGEVPSPMPERVFKRFTVLTEADPAIRRLATLLEGDDPVAGCHALMQAIGDAVAYRVGITESETKAAEALAAGQGVCQDHAHIFIAAARHRGLPARYVSGYLLLEEDQPSEAHHAWAEVRLGSLGWVGFDVSNGVCPTDRYVRLSVGLDARSAAPIRGVRAGGEVETLSVEVDVAQAAQQQ